MANGLAMPLVLTEKNSLYSNSVFIVCVIQWCHGLKKEVGQEVAIFCQMLRVFNRILMDSSNFPTEEIMDAQNFDFAPKCSQNGF